MSRCCKKTTKELKLDYALVLSSSNDLVCLQIAALDNLLVSAMKFQRCFASRHVYVIPASLPVSNQKWIRGGEKYFNSYEERYVEGI